MKRNGVLFLLLIVLLFSGCTQAAPSSAYYGLYEGESALVVFEADKTAYLVILPWSLLVGYAELQNLSPAEAVEELCGLNSLVTIERDGKDLVIVRDLLTTLVVDTTDRTRQQVDANARLEALKAGAPYLRKSGLADTLSSICPGMDMLSWLQQVQQVRAFDLSGVLDEDSLADLTQLREHISLYLEQIQTIE
ncbi:MAG: hypothetical protein ACQ5SW_05840 [Sphaerochaetaceae bacterium]